MSTMSATTTPNLMRLPQVEAATGMRRSTLYDLIRAGQFPQPVKLGRLSSWPESEVTAWIAAKIAARDAGDAPMDASPGAANHRRPRQL